MGVLEVLTNWFENCPARRLESKAKTRCEARKISTTMIYARVTQTKIGMDMNLLQNRLDKNKTITSLKAVK